MPNGDSDGHDRYPVEPGSAGADTYDWPRLHVAVAHRRDRGHLGYDTGLADSRTCFIAVEVYR